MKNIVLLLFFIGVGAVAQTGEEYYKRGLELEKNGKYTEAITYYDKADDQGFVESVLYFHRGICYTINENYKKGLEELDMTLKLNPDNLKALYFRGCVKKDLGDIEGAIKDLEALTEKDKTNTKALEKLGKIYFYDFSDFNKAIQYFEAYLKLKPDSPDVLNILGYSYGCLYTKKDLKKGIKLIDRAIALDGNTAYFYYCRGYLYFDLSLFFHKDKFDDALKDFDKAIALDSDYGKAYFERANVYFELKEYDKQIASCTKAIALKGNVGEYYFCRGLGYMAKEDKTKACEDFTEALALGYDTARGHKKIACK